MHELNKLFAPESVAIIGASREAGKVGHEVLKNIIEGGFQGGIFPVNPQAKNILGLETYGRIEDINDPVDLAVITVPAPFVPDVIKGCTVKKVPFAVIISAGFRETGAEGARLERQVKEIARQGNLRFIGPNSLGIASTFSRLNAGFAADMPTPGKIAFFSQSGALLTSVLDWSLSEGIGFSHFVSLGNKADINEEDLLRAFAEDDRCSVIAGYLEGVESGETFIKTASTVTEKKPVVIYKAGGTDAGARAVSSHTGTLAGSEAAYKAAFKQSKIIDATQIAELFDISAFLSMQPLPKGERTAILTNAGGPGIITADSCERLTIPLAVLDPDTIDVLKNSLPKAAGLYNPVDVLGDAGKERYLVAIQALLEDKGVDNLICLLTPQAMTNVEGVAEALIENTAKAISNGKSVLASFMGENRVKKGAGMLRENNIPNYRYPEKAVSTLSACLNYVKALKRPPDRTMHFETDTSGIKGLFDPQRRRKELVDIEAKKLLIAYNIDTPPGGIAGRAQEAVDLALKVGFPVAMKISSPDVIHKSDIGGVKTGVGNEQDVLAAYQEIVANTERFLPDAAIWGVTVEKQIGGAKEVIVGMNRDPQFGPVIMFGLGGIYVEVLKDVSFRVAPLGKDEALRMIKEIRAYPLLRGVRGEKPVDMDALIEVILKVSQMAIDFPQILELEINPLMVFEKGKGATAIDARLSIA